VAQSAGPEQSAHVGERLTGFLAAFLLATVVASALFVAMVDLVRTSPHRLTRSPPQLVQFNGLPPQPRNHPTKSRVPPAASPPSQPREQLAEHRPVIRRALLRVAVSAPETAPLPPTTAMSKSGAPVSWQGPMQYFSRAPWQVSFALKHISAPPASSLSSIPQRMKLSTGGEIDRIGNVCYATPAPLDDDVTYFAQI